MVRPRFTKLPAEQQATIRQAALDEFAAHGFRDASLNRVIEAAGISKGSMYYYFDGKEDLYLYVAQSELERLFARVGPFGVPDGPDPDDFWAVLQDHYLRLMTELGSSPQLAAVIRGWIAAGASSMGQAQQQLEQAVLPWMFDVLAAGRRIGAVRSDLPDGLLIAVVAGMGQAMDTWLLTEPPERSDLPGVVHALIEMIRGAVEPPSGQSGSRRPAEG